MKVGVLLINCVALLHLVPVRADRNGIFPKKECFSESSSGVVCKSSVSIECTYTDDGGDERSCLAEDDYSYFLYEEKDKCGDIFATITMTVCNDNSESNQSIMPWERGTYFVFAGKQLDPTTLFDSMLEPGQCHTISVERTINTCNKYPEYWAMSVQLKGNMPNLSGSNYCSCRLYRRSYVKKIEPIKTRPTEMKKQCMLTHNNGNICDAEVSISCEYEDDGSTKSCLGYGGRKNSKYPFVRMYDHQCRTIYANVTMTMCNNGNQVFYPWESAAFKYEGLEVDTVTNPINPNECHTWKETKAFNPCLEKSWKMSTAMYGGIGDERDWCGCYLFNDSRAYLLPEPPLVALAPSSTPSISSVPSVSSKPTQVPTVSVQPSTGPSNTPSLSMLPSPVPSSSPSISSRPSTSPSQEPSTTPSVSTNPSTSYSPSSPLIGYAVCGSTFCAKRNCGKTTDSIVDNCESTNAVVVGNPEKDLRAVRCCKTVLESQLLTDNWKRKFPETCPSGVYGASFEPDGVTCLPQEATYEDAENACAAIQGRLCTIEELQNDCTMNTGCHYDRLMVWASQVDIRSKQPSSTPSTSDVPSISPSVSANPSMSNEPSSSYTSDSPSVSMIGYAVCGTQRCGRTQCGQPTDRIPDNCEVTTPIVSDNPFADLFAVRCCTEFLTPPDFPWYRKPNTNCPSNIYSTSYEPDGVTCLPIAATYTEAAKLCSAVGGRLCTKSELSSDCTKNSGCTYDRRMIWAGELDSMYLP